MVRIASIDHGSETTAKDDRSILNEFAVNSNNPSRPNATPISDESGGFYQVMDPDVPPHANQTNISSELDGLDDDFIQQCIDKIWASSEGENNSIGSAYRSISYRFMETYKISAANLMSRFRYSLKGPVPFTLDWDNVRDKKNLKYLDSDAIKYVRSISVDIRNRDEEFKENAERVKKGWLEGDLFWLSQLYLDTLEKPK
ncbi:hypothetical protein KCU95_g1022, partial [Aureobasidium melanogenum]